MSNLIARKSPFNHRPTFFVSPLLYSRIRELALGWNIIPIVCDLKDAQLGMRLSKWAERSGLVRAIYTSNVENYLVTRGSWSLYSDFIHSLREMPLSEDAVVIKAYFPYQDEEKSDPTHPLVEKYPILQKDEDGRPYHDNVFVQRAADLIEACDTGIFKTATDIYVKGPYIDPHTGHRDVPVSSFAS